jgi:hypothetical protein
LGRDRAEFPALLPLRNLSGSPAAAAAHGVLTRCAEETLGDIEPLLTLLRRFAAEAAREEARLFCDELVAA